MNDQLRKLEDMVSLWLAGEQRPTADSIRSTIADLRPSPLFVGKISEEEAEQLARRLCQSKTLARGCAVA